MDFHLIDTNHPLHPKELELRYRVLRAPLGMPRHSTRYAHESRCLHLVAVEEDRVRGCVLFHPAAGRTGRLLQMAVALSHQRRGLGARLVAHLEREVARRGFEEVFLHARHYAVGFYEKLGYATEGAPFEEVGMPHRLMRKRL